MFDFFHCYHRLPRDISNRLDVLYNDTIFDAVEELINKSPYEFTPLGEVATLKRESRNPQSTGTPCQTLHSQRAAGKGTM